MDKQDFIDYQGKKIFYSLTGPSETKKYPAILYVHGSHSSMGSARFLLENFKDDFVVLAFSHLGIGKSDGKFEDFTLEDRLNQAIFMFDYLKSQPFIDNENISIVAASMGAHIACRLSSYRKFKNLIIRAPASYHHDYEKVKMIDQWVPWNQKTKEWPWKPSQALDDLEKFTGNLLIVKSENDEIIPDEIISEFYKRGERARRKEVVTIKGAGHRISENVEHSRQFLNFVKKFIKS